ncbi:TRAP transporter small permease [Sporosarcina obsidiansis]|uniref:TRAP transporter small permease n=1 Tax=Sporosarcina obsidiansis TaxID=2660748 RepID=UPI00129B2A39|nr:TRAP transporter small permease [Sporosarcina obsidiansis]
MLGKLSTSLDAVENVFAVIGGVLLVFNSLSVVIEVLLRSFFNISFYWVIEINEYILLYLPFLGAAWLLRDNGHITVDLLTDVLNFKTIKILDILIAIIGIIVSVVFVWFGTVETMELLEKGSRSSTVLEFPLALAAIIIPLGSVLLLLEFVRKCYNSIIRVEETV